MRVCPECSGTGKKNMTKPLTKKQRDAKNAQVRAARAAKKGKGKPKAAPKKVAPKKTVKAVAKKANGKRAPKPKKINPLDSHPSNAYFLQIRSKKNPLKLNKGAQRNTPQALVAMIWDEAQP